VSYVKLELLSYFGNKHQSRGFEQNKLIAMGISHMYYSPYILEMCIKYLLTGVKMSTLLQAFSEMFKNMKIDFLSVSINTIITITK